MEQYCRDIDPYGRSRMASGIVSGENTFIAGQVEKTGKSYWIGAVRVAETKYFWYKFNEDEGVEHPRILDELTFNRWHADEPSAPDNNQDCATMSANGEWYDEVCSDTRGAVCEIRC